MDRMNAAQRRATALRAARSELRRQAAPLTLDNAHRVLDDMARTQPQLVAAQWWTDASDNQLRLFAREWRVQ